MEAIKKKIKVIKQKMKVTQEKKKNADFMIKKLKTRNKQLRHFADRCRKLKLQIKKVSITLCQ